MKNLKKMLVVAVAIGFVGVLAANGDTMLTPLPDYDGDTPTILEGEDRDSDSGGWGSISSNPRVAYKYVTSWPDLPGSWIQWEDKNVGGAGDYDIWLSWATAYQGQSNTFTLLAGPDASNLTSRGTMTVPQGSAYVCEWDNFGTLSLAADDDTFRILLGSQGYSGRTDIDALLISKIPEPATLVMLGLGGIGVLIRRRRRA